MDKWRWANFTPKEVLSPKGLSFYRRNVFKLQGYAMDRLQWYREFLRAPISINHGHLKYRGWRSSYENANIGGRPDSTHCQGIAFDMNCYQADLAPFAVATVAYSLECAKNSKGDPAHRGFRGIGIYPKKNFIHGDFRSYAAQKEDYVVIWNGDAGGVLILHEKHTPKTLPALLRLLKVELKLPENWRL